LISSIEDLSSISEFDHFQNKQQILEMLEIAKLGRRRTSDISSSESIGTSLALGSGCGGHKLLASGQGVDSIFETLIELSSQSGGAEEESGQRELLEAHFGIFESGVYRQVYVCCFVSGKWVEFFPLSKSRAVGCLFAGA
jgi:hypothetical protein